MRWYVIVGGGLQATKTGNRQLRQSVSGRQHPRAASHILLPPGAHLEVFRKHSALPVATRAGLDVASGTAPVVLW